MINNRYEELEGKDTVPGTRREGGKDAVPGTRREGGKDDFLYEFLSRRQHSATSLADNNTETKRKRTLADNNTETR